MGTCALTCEGRRLSNSRNESNVLAKLKRQSFTQVYTACAWLCESLSISHQLTRSAQPDAQANSVTHIVHWREHWAIWISRGLISAVEFSAQTPIFMMIIAAMLLFCACVWTATATPLCISHSDCAYDGCFGQCSVLSGMCWNAAGDVCSNPPIFHLLPTPQPLTVCAGVHWRVRWCFVLTRSLWSYFGVFFLRCVFVIVCVCEWEREIVCVCERERETVCVSVRECVCERVFGRLWVCYVCARARARRTHTLVPRTHFLREHRVHALTLCVCVRACVHVCVHVCVCLLVIACTYIFAYTFVCSCIHTLLYVCMQCGPPPQGNTNSGNNSGEEDVNLGT